MLEVVAIEASQIDRQPTQPLDLQLLLVQLQQQQQQQQPRGQVHLHPQD